MSGPGAVSHERNDLGSLETPTRKASGLGKFPPPSEQRTLKSSPRDSSHFSWPRPPAFFPLGRMSSGSENQSGIHEKKKMKNYLCIRWAKKCVWVFL